jgi:NitT/TauT family transport system permease protein
VSELSSTSPAGTLREAPRWKQLWRRYDRIVYPLVTVLLILITWELAVVVLTIPAFLLPPPSLILGRLTDPVTMNVLLPNTLVSVWTMFVAFGVCVIAGVAIALALVSSRVFEKSFYPILVAAQAVPKVAIAPLLVVWFGTGLGKNVLVAVLIGIFPVVISTVIGLRSVPEEMLDLARSMQASRWSLFRKVRLPFSLPYVFAGLKTSMVLVVIGVIIGEFIGASQGIGYQLKRAQGMLDTSFLFAGIVILVFVGIASFMIVDILERLAIPWHVSSRRDAGSTIENSQVDAV